MSEAPASPGVGARALVAALTLLTILPIPAKAQGSIGAREVAASAPWFPVVGALLGLLIGLVASLPSDHAPLLAGALVAILLAGLTGALHLDGLADSFDALGARGGSRERRLEIMRDSATGAYGTVAIVGWFALVVAAATTPDPGELPLTLAFAMALARTGAVAHAWRLPPARPGGLGAGFAVTGRALAATFVALLMVSAVLVALAWAGLPWLALPGFAAVGAMAIAVVVMQLLVDARARSLLGGRTGDTLGASIALTEAAALVAAVLVA